MRYVRYTLEAVALSLLLMFFRLLPLDAASALGGKIMRSMGKFFRAHKIADANMQMAMPEIAALQRRIILGDMWENLGRVIGEYPHLSRKIMKKRITVDGLEHLEAIKQSHKGAFFASVHSANWEIAPLASALYGLPLVVVYRPPNNPFANWIIRNMRNGFSRAMYKKGREGAQNVLKAVKEGKAIGVLIDQKMNEGKAISFFNHKAMTGTAITALAIKQQVPLLLAQVVRTKGAYFHVTLQPPIYYDKNTDPTQAMQALHATLEGWIRHYPAQWFWVHKRWG